MAWTNLDPFIYFGGPGSYQFMEGIAGNFAALANGDPGAPSLLPGIAARTTAGGVGTYVFALATGGDDFAFGDTVAGSRLLPTSAAYALNGSGTSFEENFDFGTALSGTWMCMGLFDRQVGNTGTVLMAAATLWFRIA